MLYFCFFLTGLLFFTPDKTKDAVLTLAFLLLAAGLFLLNKRKQVCVGKPTPKVVISSFLLSTFFALNLYNNIYGSQTVKALASRIQISDRLLLIVLISVLTIISTAGVIFAQLSVRSIIKRQNIKDLIVVFGLCTIEFIQLQFSTVKVFNFDTGFAFAVVNIFLLFIFNIFLLLLSRRFRFVYYLIAYFFYCF